MHIIDEYFHHLVESDNQMEELSEFLDRGGDPNQKVLASNTLHHAAVQSQDIKKKVIQKLIIAGADIDLTTNVGHTPLQFAVMSRNCSSVQELIQAGADLNAQNYFGRTALHYAVGTCPPSCISQHLSWMLTPDMGIIERLLDRVNTKVNPVDIEGETPLMWAVKNGYYDAVKALLKSGANPNIPNKKGQNCLHVTLSAKTPSCHIIAELLLNGTGIYDVDDFGETAVDILLRNFRSGFPLHFVKDFLSLIAFKYPIRKDLEYKIRRVPALFEHLKKARQEVEWMNKQIIYDKITLHDFASECFQERRSGDNVLKIYQSVVEILLSGKYNVFLSNLLGHMSRGDLCIVLRRIVPFSHYMQSLLDIKTSPYQTNLQVFQFIQEFYTDMLRDNESIQ